MGNVSFTDFTLHEMEKPLEDFEQRTDAMR